MRQLMLVLLTTFVIGLMAGVYGFFLSRNYDGDTAVSEEWSRGLFEVVGEVYGGCMRAGCDSFRILEDGAYTYIHTDTSGSDGRYEDMLSQKQSVALRDLVLETDLAALEESVMQGRCPTEYDGNAYRFDIFVNDKTYVIDTCQNDTLDSVLVRELRDYFQIFFITHVR